jgi:subtilisin family serine protease
MSIYIVRSKSLSGSLVSASFSSNLGSFNRQSQINEVLALRMSDPGDQEIRRWMSDPQNHKGSMISHGERSTSVTGTVLLDMTQEQAAQLIKDVPDAMILRDQPIELIRPRRNQLLASINQVSASDLWHLQAIGLQAARSNGFQGTGAGVTVAVLDTGIDASHPELAGKVSDMVSFDVPNWQAVPQAVSTDTSGHGTHVAGLICGNQVGVAPGAKVVNGMMIPNGHGNVSDFILGTGVGGTTPGSANRQYGSRYFGLFARNAGSCDGFDGGGRTVCLRYWQRGRESYP